MNSASTQRDRGQVTGNIRDFLLAADELPSPRGAALKLIELARDPEVRIDAVVRVIRSDPALSGFVLRAASAARFGRTERSLDLQQAVIRLGMNIVRAHAVALSLVANRPKVTSKRFNYNAFWTTSLLTAAVMESVAAHRGDLPAAEAFTLGLLSEIGTLAFATAAPATFDLTLEQAARVSEPVETAEIATFGFDRHELSAVLLADWGIPTALADVVYWQRDPEGGGFDPESRSYRLACGLQLATRLSETCLAAQPDAETVGTVYLRAAILDLTPEETRKLAMDALAELPIWTDLVRLPKPVITALPSSWVD
ncbi:HDOD domain-containing protein [Aromatoleum toluvorans]|uniref:HDOD domain-containing protein n=1 Tax=Aromatoleum toluvorans TaxID=92002 RepID=A0ABX1PTE0_9RHOO|nr:HDOD domain-containing protein [Aromatoleum toluvorans]NMG42724.1 HDOD domain-containing protein [Aromatoleum toluvorans]